MPTISGPRLIQNPVDARSKPNPTVHWPKLRSTTAFQDLRICAFASHERGLQGSLSIGCLWSADRIIKAIHIDIGHRLILEQPGKPRISMLHAENCVGNPSNGNHIPD